MTTPRGARGHGETDSMGGEEDKGSLSESASSVPGVLRTPTTRDVRNVRFFTSRLTSSQRKRQASGLCDPLCGLLDLYNQGFKYVVLFKWLKVFGPRGAALRERLTIPILISIWIGIVCVRRASP